jgi:hypothetical protein
MAREQQQQHQQQQTATTGLNLFGLSIHQYHPEKHFGVMNKPVERPS